MKENYSYVGHSVDRNDSYGKTTGHAQYVADLKFPGMLYGKLIRSTIAHGYIKSIDTSEAEKLDGVVAVITAKDVPSMKYGLSPARFDENIFCIDKVRFHGDKIGAVCAVDEETCYKALKLIKVEYEELEPVLTWQDAVKEGAPQIFDEYPGNVNTEIHHHFGDVDEAMKDAYYVRTDKFQGQRAYHAFIENHCAVAYWEADKAFLYTTTQSVHYDQYHIARVLGMKMGNLTVRAVNVGAGFGGKLDTCGTEFASIILSKLTGRPVKVWFDHYETFLNGHGRHPMTMTLTTGVDKKGKIVAHKFDCVLEGGAYTGLGIASSYYAGSLLGILYPIENYKFDCKRIVTTLPPCGAQRGHGQPQPRFAFESHIDLVGEAIGVDPIDMRLINARKGNSITTAGYEVKSYNLLAANRMARDASGWTEKRGKMGPGRGIGVGNGGFVTGAGFCQYRTDYPHSVGMVKVFDDGTRAYVYSNAIDIGQGSSTVLMQMAAEAMGYPYEQCQMVTGDTDLSTLDFGAYASRQTLMAGWAVTRAGAEVKKKILAKACEMLKASGRVKEGFGYLDGPLTTEDLECKDGIVYIKQEPAVKLTFEEVARKYFVDHGALVGRGWYHPGKLGGNHKGAAVGTSPAYSSATQVAEVKVDMETGEIECVDTWDVHDSGTIINPKLFHGQVHGAFYMGIGETIWEEVKFDPKTGALLNGNFAEYRLPTALDMPPVESLTLDESYEPNGPYGCKEVGEGATTPTMGAVANAIYDAIGVSMTELPITYEKVWRALKEKKENGK
ncbi:MAG: molybdopterin-dependent oxidoreductase [Peptococcaceae bacterium]|nr:molybdopterin-dependent oxidoreductase [Peptococcaceae bacterium]